MATRLTPPLACAMFSVTVDGTALGLTATLLGVGLLWLGRQTYPPKIDRA